MTAGKIGAALMTGMAAGILAMVAIVTGACADEPTGPRWTGFYVGAHGGYAKSRLDLAAPGTPDQRLDGGIGGIQVGYRRQFVDSGLVAGIEADVTVGDLADAVKDGNYIVQASRVAALGTVRGMIGYSMGSILPYVTGGIAWEFAKTGETCPTAPFGWCATHGPYSVHDAFADAGWVYGAGIEMAVSNAVSVRAEALRVDFGSRNHELGTSASARSASQDADLVRVGINYRF